MEKKNFGKLNFDQCDSSISNQKWWALAKQVYDNRSSSLTLSALIENNMLISEPLEKARNSFNF